MNQKAVQYDSGNDKFVTWLSKLKQEIPQVSDNAKGFFDLINKGLNVDKPRNLAKSVTVE